MTGDAKMPTADIDELRVALGRPDGGEMSDRPEAQADKPETQSQTKSGGERAVEDGDAPRGAPEQNVLGQRPVNGDAVARDLAAALDQARHQTSAPPPNEKNDRKKLDAAKAIDRPKTIWISRRKPPEVSPKASVRPVTMMMITEMTLATGPWIESRICVRGCSHGMLEPAA